MEVVSTQDTGQILRRLGIDKRMLTWFGASISEKREVFSTNVIQVQRPDIANGDDLLSIRSRQNIFGFDDGGDWLSVNINLQHKSPTLLNVRFTRTTGTKGAVIHSSLELLDQQNQPILQAESWKGRTILSMYLHELEASLVDVYSATQAGFFPHKYQTWKGLDVPSRRTARLYTEDDLLCIAQDQYQFLPGTLTQVRGFLTQVSNSGVEVPDLQEFLIPGKF